MDYAMICKALGDANRLQIVSVLADGQKCACRLLDHFDISQPTMSHHMRILCDCGIVNLRKEGKWSYYTLNPQVLNEFKTFIGVLENKSREDAKRRGLDQPKE